LHHGKEIYLFFGKYEIYGILGIFISAILMGIIIYKVLIISKKEKIDNYEQFINYFNINSKVKLILQIIIQIFLLISFYVMISGFSAYFLQEWKIPNYIGTLIIIVLSYIIFMGNIERIIKVNTILVPILIASILLLILKNTTVFTQIQYTTNKTSIIQAIYNAIIYTSYNSIVLIPILVPLSQKINNNKFYITISIICTLILIILAVSIYGLILKIDIDINKIELPTVYVAGMMGTKYQIIYGMVILVSIYTSAISAGYGFLEKYKNNKIKYKKTAILMCLCAFLISNIGFTTLLNLLYPICGLLGLLQLILILKK
jgi:uncharacterized membrane protein YkvI